ncbi:MAG: hypothetical protein KDE50_11995, partial [Caldilineaceae bacterium]|nr:hypothetical protein [Caldilineaceae bacterium]
FSWQILGIPANIQRRISIAPLRQSSKAHTHAAQTSTVHRNSVGEIGAVWFIESNAFSYNCDLLIERKFGGKRLKMVEWQ